MDRRGGERSRIAVGDPSASGRLDLERDRPRLGETEGITAVKYTRKQNANIALFVVRSRLGQEVLAVSQIKVELYDL